MRRFVVAVLALGVVASAAASAQQGVVTLSCRFDRLGEPSLVRVGPNHFQVYGDAPIAGGGATRTSTTWSENLCLREYVCSADDEHVLIAQYRRAAMMRYQFMAGANGGYSVRMAANAASCNLADVQG